LQPGTELLWYALSFTAEGKTPVTAAAHASTTDIELEEGTWNLEVQGYAGEEEMQAADPSAVVAAGSVEVTLAPRVVTPVSVPLTAITESGEGALYYDIRFPAAAQSAVLNLTVFAGGLAKPPVDLITAGTSGDGVIRTTGTLDALAAGYYRLSLEISLYDEDAGITRTARKTALVHIYDGQETRSAESFGTDDFAGALTFTTVEAMAAYLEAAEMNTEDTPYRLALRDIDIETGLTEGSDSLGKLYNNLKGRYVALDLSSCSGEVIADVTSAIATARISSGRLVSLILPPTLKTIGNYAFYNEGALKSVDWPVAPPDAAIGAYAFYGCRSLVSLKLPGYLTAIGNYGFAGCRSLSGALALPDTLTTIGAHAFSNLSLSSVDWPVAPEGAALGEQAFRDCSSLVSVRLPATLTSIGNYAFSSCISLGSISLPEALTSIGDYAFSGCRSLSSVDWPAITAEATLGTNAFANCNILASISLPEGLTAIGYAAFANCGILASISLPEGLTTIAYGVFNGTSLKTVSLPTSLTSIGEWAFSGLESVYIPAELTARLDGIVFGRHNSLVYHVDPANALYTLGPGEKTLLSKDGTILFSVSDVTGNFIVPSEITEIGSGAFYSSDLTSVNLPAGLKIIGNYAFYYCSLTSIILPQDLTEIGSDAFSYCPLSSVSLPSKLKTVGRNAFKYCRSLEWLKWPVSAADATFEGGTLVGCSNLEKVELPDNLISIGANTFVGLPKLRVFILKGETPPTLLSSNMFGTTTSNEELRFYVPHDKVSTYTSTGRWGSTAAIKAKIVSINTLDPSDDPDLWQ
jgi:hypothetical protein